MKKLISSIILTLFVAFPVMSEINVGISGSIIGFYGEGTETETNGTQAGAGPLSDQISKTSAAGAFEENFNEIFVEYDAGPIIVGLSYNPENIETPENVNLQSQSDQGTDSFNNTVKAEFENLLTLYAIVPTPLFGFYGKVGYIQADITTLEVLGTGGNYPDTDTSGFVAGIGYQQDIGSWFVRAEVLGAMYDDVILDNTSLQNFGGTATGASTEATAKRIAVTEMMSANATLAVGYSF